MGPWQCFGIEVKPWARELAELTLWVGYYQWWRQTHGHTLPPEPVLRDTGTLECRDAILAWDEIVHLPEKDRPDPRPQIEDPVTGKLVPDPEAKLKYMEYRGARRAEWPEADFIVGNPPYIGAKRLRDALGDGYVAALMDVYDGVVSRSSDLVMYWWARAAEEVATGRSERFGLITTNSISSAFNRHALEVAADAGAHVIWACRDHPWVDDEDGAAVRVAMTVVARDSKAATLVKFSESSGLWTETDVENLNADLTAHADVATASGRGLLANEGMSSQGFILVGLGFVLDDEEGRALLAMDSRHADVVRPYLTGRDLASRDRGQFIIDFGLRSEEEARDYPVLFDIVRSRVKPQRDSTKRKSMRDRWWLFGEPRSTFRPAVEGLSRYIGTVQTAKHRIFTFLPAETATSDKIICIAFDDPYHLGVLSSRIHCVWALASGARLGKGNDPVYTKSKCFDPFPFPDAEGGDREIISGIANRLETHRKRAIERSETVTMTGMYNVVQKLRSGQRLTAKEREVHTHAACGVLRDLHDELDQAVARSYGWPNDLADDEILSRLVALHGTRIREEEAGSVRWLRPEYQVERFGKDLSDTTGDLDLEAADLIPDADQPGEWPEHPPQQLAALQRVVGEGALTVIAIRKLFPSAKRAELIQHLEALVVLGLVRETDEGAFVSVRPMMVTAA